MTVTTVGPGPAKRNLSVFNTDELVVLNGGVAIATQVLAPAYASGAATNLDVQAGGVASGTSMTGGFALVEAGGLASGTVLSGGAAMNVAGTASGSVVSGSTEAVLAGGSSTSATISSGGTQAVAAGEVRRVRRCSVAGNWWCLRTGRRRGRWSRGACSVPRVR